MNVQKWCPTCGKDSFLTPVLESIKLSCRKYAAPPARSSNLWQRESVSMVISEQWWGYCDKAGDRDSWGTGRLIPKNGRKWQPLAGKALRLEGSQLDHTGLSYQGEEFRFSSECKGQGRFKEGSHTSGLYLNNIPAVHMWRMDCSRGKVESMRSSELGVIEW